MSSLIAFLIGIGIAATLYCVFKLLPISQVQSNGEGSIQIQSDRSGRVSIVNKSGHIKIKGNVHSVTVNGRKIYD